MTEQELAAGLADGTLLTSRDAGAGLGLARSTTNRWIREGRLISPGRLGQMNLVTRESVEAYAKDRRPQGRPPFCSPEDPAS